MGIDLKSCSRVLCVATRLPRNRRAATAIEYALLAGFIAVVVFAGVLAVGESYVELLSVIEDAFADMAQGQ